MTGYGIFEEASGDNSFCNQKAFLFMSRQVLQLFTCSHSIGLENGNLIILIF